MSSTNSDEQRNDERIENANVIVKQQPPSVDFENDPEAGPSGLQGLQMEPLRSNANDGHRMCRYHSDSDDDSGDECASAMWRPQESYRFNREEDSGDTRFSNQSWRYGVPAANETPSVSDIAPSTSNPADEVIDLSENESVQSNVLNAAPSNAHRSLEVLTAPDLQLDWLSDSSSDNEIVCTIRSQSPENTALNLSQSNLTTLQVPNPIDSNHLPPIDLTASDEEDNLFASSDSGNGPTIVGSRSSGLARDFMNQHYRLTNMYYRCRRPLRSPNFRSESRNER